MKEWISTAAPIESQIMRISIYPAFLEERAGS